MFFCAWTIVFGSLFDTISHSQEHDLCNILFNELKEEWRHDMMIQVDNRVFMTFRLFLFLFFFLLGDCWIFEISRVQDPLDQLSVMSVHIMYTGFQIVSLKNSGKPEQSAPDSDDEFIWYCFQIVSLKSCGGLWAAPDSEEHYFHVILCFQIAS